MGLVDRGRGGTWAAQQTTPGASDGGFLGLTFIVRAARADPTPISDPLTQQRQHVLGRQVRRRQDRRSRLLEDLRPRQGGGLKGKVRIADHRFARGDVLQADLKRSNVRLDRVALKRAESTAKDRDVADRALQNLCRLEGST